MSTSAARRLVAALIVGSALVRLWLAAITGLGFDESYMVGNARQLMLGYVDHPPLHVWMAWLVQTVFQSEAPIVVRAPFIALFAGTTWLMFRLTEWLFGPAAAVWAAVVLNLLPVFSLADGTWVLPDGPLVFFLLAAANAVARIVLDDRPPRQPTAWWIAAGVFAGLALLSKYNAILFPVGVLLFLASVPAGRRQLVTAGPWLGILAALAVFSPALVWNSQHGFAGFLFQGSRLAGGPPGIGRFLLAIGGQLLYLTPWLGVPLAISLVAALRTGRGEAKGWFLALLAVVPIVFFSLAAFLAPGLPHWPMPGWLFAVPLFGRDAAALATRRPRFARGYMAASAVVFAILVSAFVWQATRGGLLPRILVADNPAVDPTIDLIDWHELRAALAERGLLGPALVVASTRWFHAGKASYALGGDVPMLCLCDKQQQFAFRDDRARWTGSDVVVVVPRHAGGWDEVAAYFDALEPLESVLITRGRETALVLELRVGRNLQFR